MVRPCLLRGLLLGGLAPVWVSILLPLLPLGLDCMGHRLSLVFLSSVMVLFTMPHRVTLTRLFPLNLLIAPYTIVLFKVTCTLWVL